jgi:hypothetical protein
MAKRAQLPGVFTVTTRTKSNSGKIQASNNPTKINRLNSEGEAFIGRSGRRTQSRTPASSLRFPANLAIEQEHEEPAASRIKRAEDGKSRSSGIEIGICGQSSGGFAKRLKTPSRGNRRGRHLLSIVGMLLVRAPSVAPMSDVRSPFHGTTAQAAGCSIAWGLDLQLRIFWI